MELSDEALVQQAIGLNDVTAFEQLVRRHQPRILLLQRKFVRDHALAEDLCQETFLRAWRKLHTFRGSGGFSAWLAKLAYNVFLQHIRKSGKTKWHISLDANENLELPAQASSGLDETPDLPKLLGILSSEEQLIMVLNYGHGLSNTEISGLLDVPVGTVKAKIHRAKEKIRHRFKIGTG